MMIEVGTRWASLPCKYHKPFFFNEEIAIEHRLDIADVANSVVRTQH